MLGNNHPVGIFDSGVGGLTVVKAFLEQLPQEDLIYFGDTAHVPYGNKSEAQLMQYAHDIMDYFMERKVKAVLVACGTHSSVTLPRIQAEYPIPMVGMVRAAARAACRITSGKRVGVLATQATVNSHAYRKAIQDIMPDCHVFEAACPLFVSLVEAGILTGEEPIAAAKQYLEPLLREDIDTLVLGCTHYPFLQDILTDLIGEVTLLDPAIEAVKEMKAILTGHDLLNQAAHQSRAEFLVSGDNTSFYRVGTKLLGKVINEVKSVTLTHC